MIKKEDQQQKKSNEQQISDKDVELHSPTKPMYRLIMLKDKKSIITDCLNDIISWLSLQLKDIYEPYEIQNKIEKIFLVGDLQKIYLKSSSKAIKRLFSNPDDIELKNCVLQYVKDDEILKGNQILGTLASYDFSHIEDSLAKKDLHIKDSELKEVINYIYDEVKEVKSTLNNLARYLLQFSKLDGDSLKFQGTQPSTLTSKPLYVKDPKKLDMVIIDRHSLNFLIKQRNIAEEALYKRYSELKALNLKEVTDWRDQFSNYIRLETKMFNLCQEISTGIKVLLPLEMDDEDRKFLEETYLENDKRIEEFENLRDKMSKSEIGVKFYQQDEGI